MVLEISAITVGAVLLVVLLLTILTCISGQRDKSVPPDHKGTGSTGNYLFVVFICICEHTYCKIKCFKFMKIQLMNRTLFNT